MRRLLLVFSVVLLLLAPARAQRNTGYYEDYLQYLPAAMNLGLDLVGAQSVDGYPDILIASATTFLTEALMVNALKLVVKEERPNGNGWNSFPSGHSATAYAGAELVRLEYGWGWGTAAYVAATAVAYGRVAHRTHWWWDTTAGGVIGILSAHLGYSSVRPIKRLFGMELPKETTVSLYPVVEPRSGALCTTLAFTF